MKKLNLMKLKANKASPEILLAAGIIGVVTSTIMACKATLKLRETKSVTSDLISTLETTWLADPEGYPEKEYNKDLALATFQGYLNLVMLYAPAALVGAISISALIGSHNILSRRNVALISAYKLLDEGFKKYRSRVIESIGDEADNYFRYGGEKKEFKPVELKKKNKEECDTPPCMKLGDESIYAKFFDESSLQFKKNNSLNYFFLKGQQNYANDLLKSNGHVFLNEVYDMLGLPRTKPGAIVGWVYDSNRGDGFIDFNIHNPLNEFNRDFVNGYANAVLLDFNVDGVIYDLI